MGGVERPAVCYLACTLADVTVRCHVCSSSNLAFGSRMLACNLFSLRLDKLQAHFPHACVCAAAAAAPVVVWFQVAKVLMTRSARDISIIWSLLYSTGLVLSLAYLILKVRVKQLAATHSRWMVGSGCTTQQELGALDAFVGRSTERLNVAVIGAVIASAQRRIGHQG